MSNFSFLSERYPILANVALSAESYLHGDPNAALHKLRIFGELITERLFDEHFLEFPLTNTFHNRLKVLENDGVIYGRVKDLFFSLKQKGNLAAHSHKGSLEDTKAALFGAFKMAKWFYATYATDAINVEDVKFSLPKPAMAKQEYQTLEAEYEQLKKDFDDLLKNRDTTPENHKARLAEIEQRSLTAERRIDFSEKETRDLIDQQLREAGWEANTNVLNYKKNKSLPQKGKNRAIAEWSCGRLWADYALFIGEQLYAIVEAKRYASDISTDLGQAKKYALNLPASENNLGSWNEMKVPFLFATNGRPYLQQLQTKSGIWFLDVRNAKNISKALLGWYSPEGLKALAERSIGTANDKLRQSDYHYLEDKSHLGLRAYQVEAIKSVEKKIVANTNERRALLTMATGTGKTRTVVGLAYRLIKSNRFKRILFLTDRTLLASQALGTFKDEKVENLNTFSEVYRVEEMKDLIPDVETRLHFATVQSLVKRLFYNETEENGISVDTYDCIIVDEAHRGYLLDREMNEGDWNFKDQRDYVSQYRRVLEYFDAFAIGLTATPALHTREIFGKATFTYSYREAVIDGYLVDHEPPIIINTKLLQEGITWQKGEKPKVYNPETNRIEELEELEDELNFDITAFNKQVITEPFNNTVAGFLANHLDPEGEEKTLIFCANDQHADLVLKLLKEALSEKGWDIGDNTIEKITGSVYKPQERLRSYKNEQWPNIAVTVDLLTTGIDVPPICNIVFLRRVKSRILYEQMLGRATRLCPEIGKETFRIYDAVKLYDALEEYTQMRPVVANPKAGFAELVDELDLIEEEERIQLQVEQIIAKLRRKSRSMTPSQQEIFEAHTGGQTPNDWMNSLPTQPTEKMVKNLKQLKDLWNQIDSWRPRGKWTLVSDHEDKILEHERGYGEGNQRPEDYLRSFEAYIQNNRAKLEALKLVCTKPTELTRAALRDLRLKLDMEGFSTSSLQTAWRETKNEDIAADIISYIRTIALGTTLESREQKVQRAMQTVQQQAKWTAIQKRWLGRIEKQLLAETVLRIEDLDQDPFKQYGGLAKMEKVFEGKLGQTLEKINQSLYSESA